MKTCLALNTLIASILFTCFSTEAAQTPNPKWDAYKFDGTVGELRTNSKTRAISVRVTGDREKTGTFVYEPPHGWTIVDFKVRTVSSINDAGYTVSMTARDSSMASEDQIKNIAKSTADYSGNIMKTWSGESHSRSLEDVILSRTRKFQSRNNHLEIPWHAKASTRKTPLGVVIDRRNASLKVDVDIVLGRVLTDKEAQIVEYRLKRELDKNGDPFAPLAKFLPPAR